MTVTFPHPRPPSPTLPLKVYTGFNPLMVIFLHSISLELFIVVVVVFFFFFVFFYCATDRISLAGLLTDYGCSLPFTSFGGYTSIFHTVYWLLLQLSFQKSLLVIIRAYILHGGYFYMQLAFHKLYSLLVELTFQKS